VQPHHRRDVVYAAPSRRTAARTKATGARQQRSAQLTSDLQAALGAAAGTLLVGSVLYTYVDAAVLSDESFSALEARLGLSIESLCRHGGWPVLTHMLLHLDPLHLLGSLAVLVPSAAAAALAPTYLHRWLAIVVVFAAAGLVGGAVQLGPDLRAALDFAALHAPYDRRHFDPAVELGAQWRRFLADADVQRLLEGVRSTLSGTRDVLLANEWVFSSGSGRFRVNAYGASAGAAGLCAFAACEWALGGARVRSALLVPAAMALFDLQRRRRSDSDVVAYGGPGERRQLGRPVAFSPRIEAEAHLAGLATGVGCWLGGRGVRAGAQLLRLLFARTRGR
jgi:hypothetical protein